MMRSAADVFDVIIDRLIGDFEDAGAPTFARHRAQLSLRLVRGCVVFCIVFAIALWPTDWLVFPAHSAIPIAYAKLRFAFIAGMIALLAGLRWSTWLQQRPVDAMAAATLAGCWLSAATVAQTFAAGEPFDWFYAIYLLPFVTLTVVVPVVQRAALTIGLSAACLVLMALSNDVMLSAEYVTHPAINIGFASLVSIWLGHAGYQLIEGNFRERRELKARAAELAALDRTQARVLARMGRELRAPLDEIVRGLSEVASDGASKDSLPSGARAAARVLEIVGGLRDGRVSGVGDAEGIGAELPVSERLLEEQRLLDEVERTWRQTCDKLGEQLEIRLGCMDLLLHDAVSASTGERARVADALRGDLGERIADLRETVAAASDNDHDTAERRLIALLRLDDKIGALLETVSATIRGLRDPGSDLAVEIERIADEFARRTGARCALQLPPGEVSRDAFVVLQRVLDALVEHPPRQIRIDIRTEVADAPGLVSGGRLSANTAAELRERLLRMHAHLRIDVQADQAVIELRAP